MIHLKPKDAIKVAIVKQEVSETYPKEVVLPEDIYISWVNNIEIKKDKLLTFLGV